MSVLRRLWKAGLTGDPSRAVPRFVQLYKLAHIAAVKAAPKRSTKRSTLVLEIDRHPGFASFLSLSRSLEWKRSGCSMTKTGCREYLTMLSEVLDRHGIQTYIRG